jgi:DNA-binding LacI/PurR family transcriptional regulator
VYPGTIWDVSRMRKVKGLKEIAELAGLSTGTVSRALSGSGRVSEKTRSRVTELADKLGYQPNLLARRLRTQTTKTIGVLIPLGHERQQHLSDPFFNTMTGFLADELADHGYDLLLSRVIPDNDRWLDSYVDSGRVDGLIVIGQSNQMPVIDSVARRYRSMVVWGGRVSGQNYCVVGSDNRKGGEMAARHLFERGCRRIAYAGPVDGPEFGERLAGVQQTHDEQQTGSDLVQYKSRFEPNAAKEDLLYLFRSSDALPDGIVAGSDVTAISVLRALSELHIKVPEEVKVIGYDGLPIGELITPPLTTVDQNLRLGARHMVELLMKRIEGHDVASYLIKPQLIIRGST